VTDDTKNTNFARDVVLLIQGEDPFFGHNFEDTEAFALAMETEINVRKGANPDRADQLKVGERERRIIDRHRETSRGIGFH
jgi:hypothetical protein